MVREVGADAIGAFLAGLDVARKDALLVALACAVDLERTAQQWWGWLEAPAPPRAQPCVRPVPRVAQVQRFARDNGLSDDQVWRAIVDLHAAASPSTAPSGQR